MGAGPCCYCAWSDGEPLLRLLFHWHILRAGGSRGRDGLRRSLAGCPGDVTRHGAEGALLVLPQTMADATALTAISTADRKMEQPWMKTGE